MTKETKATTIEIMGKPYQIKCPEDEVESLQQAAQFLEEKMWSMREAGKVLSLDRLAVIAALNIAHQFLNVENKNSDYLETIQKRLYDLQNKVEKALEQDAQTECRSAE